MKILLVSVPHTLVVDLFFCAVISFYKIDLVEHPLSQLLGYSDHLLHNMWGPAGCSYELRAAWSISPLGQSGSDDALFLGLKRGWKWHTQIHSELSLAQCSPHFNNYCQPETLVLIFPLPYTCYYRRGLFFIVKTLVRFVLQVNIFCVMWLGTRSQTKSGETVPPFSYRLIVHILD